MSIIALIVILLVIVVPIYLCYDSDNPYSEGNKKIKVFGATFLYGFLGMILSVILFYFLPMLPLGNIDSMLVAVMVLGSMICGCAAWIVQTIKNNAK